MKVFFRRIHLYLGLGAGLVIMICCLTGAILVFQKELEQVFHKQRYFAQEGEKRMSLDSLVAGVKKNYPGAKVNSVKVYTNNEQTTEVNVTVVDKKQNTTQPTTATKKQEPRTVQRSPTFTAYVNP